MYSEEGGPKDALVKSVSARQIEVVLVLTTFDAFDFGDLGLHLALDLSNFLHYSRFKILLIII